jgi:cell division protein FtsZ
MTLNLTIPQQTHTDFTPRITVIGVGGGGTNAVDNMIALDLKGVDFVVANTDAQQLMQSKAERRIQLGPHITQGLGAGAKPEIGRAAAEEAADELYRYLDGVHMVFITAGMGGGTGTGAAPVIARMARERNILTVGVVTKPFAFEGSRRARAADLGITELQQYVDTLIVIPNQNLFRLANERTGWKEAFKMADHVLYMGVRGVTDLMVAPGLVNLDFADIRTVMAEMGKAMMGTGEADGENRAVRAAEAAISNPLLEDTSMAGARGLLINITGGEDMTLFEVDQAANRIREEVEEDANIIFGSAIDDSLEGKIRVSVVATGIDTPAVLEAQRPHLVAVGLANIESGRATAEVGRAAGPAPAGAPSGQAQAAMAAGRAAAPAQAPRGVRPFTRSASPQLQPVIAGGEREREMIEDPAGEALVAHGNAALAGGRPMPNRGPMAAGDVSAQPSRPAHRGLFAQAARPVQQAAQDFGSQEQAMPQPQPQPHRASLFGIVTGAIRRNLPAAAAETATTRHDPTFHDQPEPPRASVRLAAGEEMGLDIPAFLRRQSS